MPAAVHMVEHSVTVVRVIDGWGVVLGFEPYVQNEVDPCLVFAFDVIGQEAP